MFEFLDLLLERLPPQWGVIVASRTEPPLSLARLRAHGELAEFRQRELRFTLDEVRALLPQARRTLDPRRPASGSPAHARLGGRPAPGGSTHPPGPRRAGGVADTAATPRLRLPAQRSARRAAGASCAASCCAARCSRADRGALRRGQRRPARGRVARGDRAARPVRLGAARAETTLRLHDLFRDFLRDRLHREMADELPTLHRAPPPARPTCCAGSAISSAPATGARRKRRCAKPARRSSPPSASRRCCACSTSFPPKRSALGRPGAHALPCAWSRWDWPTMREAGRRAAPRSRARGDGAAPGARASTNRSRTSPRAATRRRAGAIDAPARETLGRRPRPRRRRAQLHRPRQRPPRRSRPRYREMVDIARAEPRSGALVPVRAAQPAMRPARHARAGAPLRGRRARGRARSADAAARDRAGELGVERLSSGQSRRGAPGLAEADARWLGPPPNVRLALYACCRAVRDARPAQRQLRRARRDPRPLRRSRRRLPARLALLRVLSPVRGPPRRLARRQRARRAPGGRAPDYPRPRPGCCGRCCRRSGALPGRLAWHAAVATRRAPATRGAAPRGRSRVFGKTSRCACAWRWPACASATSTPPRRRSRRCSSGRARRRPGRRAHRPQEPRRARRAP